MSFFTNNNEKETNIIRSTPPISRTQHPRSVTSHSSITDTDQGIKSITISHWRVPPRCRPGNTAIRSRHPQDSEVHDTRSHHHNTRLDCKVHQGPVEDLSLPTVALEPKEILLLRKPGGGHKNRRRTVIESQYLYTIITLKRIQSVKNGPSMHE